MVVDGEGIRIAFAGDRDIGLRVLTFLLSSEVKPLALLVSDEDRASHSEELIESCSFLDPSDILKGSFFRASEGVSVLEKLDLDYIICVHFPYLMTKPVLSIPRYGVINLHPAFLPFNRGWHTPSWAILDGTPIGATLHFMDEGVDTGDIIYQEQLEILPGDTANTLYEMIKELEFEVFKKSWPQLVSGTYRREKQCQKSGTIHRRKELFSKSIQEIDLYTPIHPKDFIRKLRGLTTNRIEEAAYFEIENKRYRVQITIQDEGVKNA